jgi:hypothetical protein
MRRPDGVTTIRAMNISLPSPAVPEPKWLAEALKFMQAVGHGVCEVLVSSSKASLLLQTAKKTPNRLP